MPKQMRRRAVSDLVSPAAVSPLVQLWLLRLLVPLGCHRDIHHQGFSQDDRLTMAVGLTDLLELELDELTPAAFRKKLGILHAQGERKLRNSAVPPCLGANVARLSKLVGLSDSDCRILEFSVLIHTERILDGTAESLGQLSSLKLIHALSVLLDLPESDVRTSLSPKGILAKSGLLSVDRCGTSTLRGKLNLLSDNFADHVYSSESDPVDLLRDTVIPSSPPLLETVDYSHVSEFLDVLRPYLKNAVASGRKGVNLFLHGASGTGKSQLTKVLAQELGCELFEVASEDSDGDPVLGPHRLRAFSAAQSFLAQRRALILFDEVEDVFNDGSTLSGGKSTAQTRKAWINRALEENPVPALWLSNSIEGLDPAFIRRFDMVFELGVPPKRHREHIIMEACADMLDATAIARIAESETLAPAVVARAASVVRTIRTELGASGTSKAVEMLIGNTLVAQGHPAIRRIDSNRLPEIYDPVFIHADTDLAVVTAGLVRSKSGRLCLYGPPGTGKTAYGRWLAEQLGVPLMVKRASDLMSMWVGKNEKNIARAFKAAEQEGAILLIDEVDSFLQDRRGAHSSWEVTLVNEMLTQMESFPGVFIASTNLMDGLDQASLRRFDLKVKFDFLKTDQAWELLMRHCAALGLAKPCPAQRNQIDRSSKLTPGDFAAVVRQHRFRPIESAAALLKALEDECALKEGARSVIGFV